MKHSEQATNLAHHLKKAVGIAYILFVLIGMGAGAAPTINIGDSEAVVQQVLGVPRGRMQSGRDTILTFGRGLVMIRDGRVVDYDLISEVEAQERARESEQRPETGFRREGEMPPSQTRESVSPRAPARGLHNPLEVTNISCGETVRHPLILLQGTLSGDALRINGVRDFCVTAHRGRFKALVDLPPGRHTIGLDDGHGSASLSLTYVPATTGYRVRPLYVIASDGTPDGHFEDKISTVMKVLQSFTAESMHRRGYGRRTFHLDFQSGNRVDVPLMRLRQSQASVDKHNIYGTIADALRGHPIFHSSSGEGGQIKVVAISGIGHAARGGGRLAVFSDVAMRACWPRRVQDIIPCFLDYRDVGQLDPYSDHRAWRNATISIGATLHELGHTWGLWHAGGRCDIMQRGFTSINRAFTLYEPTASGHKRLFPEQDVADWGDQALLLHYTRWFYPDRERFESSRIAVRVLPPNAVYGSDKPLAALGWSYGSTHVYEDVSARRSRREVRSFAAIRAAAGDSSVLLWAIDQHGNTAFLNVDP